MVTELQAGPAVLDLQMRSSRFEVLELVGNDVPVILHRPTTSRYPRVLKSTRGLSVEAFARERLGERCSGRKNAWENPRSASHCQAGREIPAPMRTVVVKDARATHFPCTRLD